MITEETHSLSDIRSARAAEYYKNKTNLGRIDNPTIEFSYTGPCKETIKFYMLIEGGNIKDIKFQYIGCSVLASCSSALCEIIKGKDLGFAKAITPEDIKDHLGISRDTNIDCPLLAVRALRKAIYRYETGNKG